MGKSFLRGAISISLCLVVGIIAAVATQSSVHGWFTQLNKPIFNPPSWLFAPVWTFLYILMGIAAARVWNKGFYHKWVKTALYHFGIQLLLNAMWSVVFFGLRLTFPALIVIIALLVFLIFTYKWFKVVDPKAAYLLVPYILWTAFATALNFEIWRLN